MSDLENNEHRTPNGADLAYGGTAVLRPTRDAMFADIEFTLPSGRHRLSDWSDGQSTIILSVEDCRTPHRLLELHTIVSARGTLDQIGARILALTTLTDAELRAWKSLMRGILFLEPLVTLVADPDGDLVDQCAQVASARGKRAGTRQSFLIDPALRVTAILEQRSKERIQLSRLLEPETGA